MMSIMIGGILCLVLIFMGLIYMLTRFMKENLKGHLGHLDTLNLQLQKKETELNQKITALDQEYSAKVAKMEQEMTTRQVQSRQEVTKMLEEGRQQAMKEREKIISEAVTTRDKIRNEIMAEMETKAVGYSHTILSEFFSGQLRTHLHDMLMHQLIEGIREVDVARFDLSAQAVEIRSAQPLPDAVRAKIHQAIKDRTGKDVQISVETDPSLVGGATLKFGSFVIDGSMDNLLKEAAARLKKETHRRYQGTT